MKRSYRSTLILALVGIAVLSLAAVVVAKPGHGGAHAMCPMADRFVEHRFERLAEYLELTEAQRAEAEALHDRWLGDAREVHETTQASFAKIHEMAAAENPDATAIGELVIQMHRDHQAMRQAHEAWRAELVELLTPEQVEKLEAWEAARPEGMGFGRHGRHGGPHGGRFSPPDAD